LVKERNNLYLVLGIFVFFILINLQFVFADTFEFNGTIKDENGNALNNSFVNITIRDNQFTILNYTSGVTNESGWFNISITSNSSWIYEPSFTHVNTSSNFVDFKSKSIPAFPSTMLQLLAGTTFYLTPAGTINITAVNST